MTVYSPGFASIALPVVVTIEITAIIGGFVITYRRIRRAVKHRRETVRAPFRQRLAAQAREIWGGQVSIRRDGDPVSESDAEVLAAWERDFRRGHYAAEPRRARRRP